MRITTVLWTGATALTLASCVDSGTQFFPLAMPAVVGILKLRDRVPEMTRGTFDARLSSFILDVLMGLVFVLSVSAWSIGPVLVMVGYAGNHLAILTNGLAMPSVGSLGINPTNTPITDRTRLRWLTDIYLTGADTDHSADFSIGDAFIAVGLWVYSAELILIRFVS